MVNTVTTARPLGLPTAPLAAASAGLDGGRGVVVAGLLPVSERIERLRAMRA